ncbi:MAG TPA: hypothetical protein PK390_05935, partial [Fervidobacterium nodosum]|nr:hypothetical protein [Fervidobacterium nodosum]
DKALIEYCDKNHMVYTRYADDITISTNEELTNEKLSQIMQDIKAIIKPYEINERKLKVYGPNDVHYVLGLVVNKKVNVEKRYRRAIRAAIYNYIHKHVVPKGVDPIKYKRQLLGKTAYCLYINKISSLQKQYDELKAFDPNKVQEWNYVLIDS